MMRWVGLRIAAVAIMASVAGPAGATRIVTGAAAFAEPDGGATSPGFSGTLAFELFDSGGGFSALAGAPAPTLGSDFTLVFRITLDPDVDHATRIAAVSMSAFQLGPGDGNLFTSPGPTSGGAIGASDPVFSAGTLGKFADYDFTGLPGGGLAEGSSSAAFYFTVPNVDLGPGGSTQVAVGDQLTVGFTSVNANSVDIQLTIVPEPASGLLLGWGLLAGASGWALRRRRRERPS